VRRALLSLIGTALWAVPSGQAAGFDFASLQSLLQREHIDSVERLLAALPAAQRTHYALMFESRSLQSASFDNPRVILFGPDARFIVTFNGSPAQRGFDTVETMEFDELTKQFRLRELRFAESSAEGLAVVVSEPNPSRCARCHGTPAQPIWDTLPLWPGAYGERYRASLSARESGGLSRFLAVQSTHARYRYLLGAQRFANPKTFRASALSDYSGLAAEPPNAELAGSLSRLQSQAIARRLAQQPAFSTYQYALLGVVDNACGQLADFYPAALWRSQRAAFERFAADTAAANLRQARLKTARARGGGAPLAPDGVSVDNAWLPVRFVAETALGSPTRSWTLALERGSYDFTQPPLGAQPLRESLLVEVAAHDPAVRDSILAAGAQGAERYCSYLQRRSIAALSPTYDVAEGAGAASTPSSAVGPGALASSVAAPPATMSASIAAGTLDRPPALQLCVSCHESGVAPPVPFSDPIQLTQQLRTRPAAHGTLLDEILFRLSAAAGLQHMPLGLNLADADRQNLENYFTTLAAFSN
jgi:cytochrome c553